MAKRSKKASVAHATPTEDPAGASARLMTTKVPAAQRPLEVPTKASVAHATPTADPAGASARLMTAKVPAAPIPPLIALMGETVAPEPTP